MHQTRRRLLLGLGGVLLPLLVGAFVAPGSQATAGENRGGSPVPSSLCKRSALAMPPLWTGSGAWNGDDLVLIDTVRRRLLPYSADGRARVEPQAPLAKALVDLYPTRIAAAGDGRLVVQADASRFLLMDGGYAKRGDVLASLLAAQDGSGSTIDKIYTLALAGQDIVAFADVKTPGVAGVDRWSTGIVRLYPGKGSFEVLHNLPRDDVSRKYHRLGYAYIAGLGDTAFYLLMGNGTHLWRHEQGKEPEDLGDLERFFPLWKKSPALPSYVSAQDFVSVMETAEESSMPTGLYGWKDPASGQEALYLVSRQVQNGKTQWLLTKLLPKNGRSAGTVLIRSDANHLFAVPGPSQWAIVEKGPAVALQEQEVKNVFILPAEKVRRSFDRPAAQGGKGLSDICQ